MRLCGIGIFKVPRKVLEVQLRLPDLETVMWQTVKGHPPREGGGWPMNLGSVGVSGPCRPTPSPALGNGRQVPGSLPGQGEWEESTSRLSLTRNMRQ